MCGVCVCVCVCVCVRVCMREGVCVLWPRSSGSVVWDINNKDFLWLWNRSDSGVVPHVNLSVSPTALFLSPVL